MDEPILTDLEIIREAHKLSSVHLVLMVTYDEKGKKRLSGSVKGSVEQLSDLIVRYFERQPVLKIAVAAKIAASYIKDSLDD